MENDYFSSHFWSPLKDEQQARDAVKMAGLPVFLIGLNAFFIAPMTFWRPWLIPGAIWVNLTIGAILMVIALRMRKGHCALMLVAMVPLFVFYTLVVLQTVSLIMIVEPWQKMTVQILSSWVVPALCSILTYRGLLGWFWLRARKLPMSY